MADKEHGQRLLRLVHALRQPDTADVCQQAKMRERKAAKRKCGSATCLAFTGSTAWLIARLQPVLGSAAKGNVLWTHRLTGRLDRFGKYTAMEDCKGPTTMMKNCLACVLPVKQRLPANQTDAGQHCQLHFASTVGAAELQGSLACLPCCLHC